MNQKYTILLEKYLCNQLSYEEQVNFEFALLNNIQLCEDLKSSSKLPEHTFLRMYNAIKAKFQYKMKMTS